MSQCKNLIIGGVHKAGTTSLYTYLSWHPDVCASEIKETHFFSGRDVSFAGEVRHKNYDGFFVHCKDAKVWVESSPEYIYGKKSVAQRIYDALPSAKLVFILRNPVDKIISSFQHRKKKMDIAENVGFDEFAAQHLNFNSIDEVLLSDSPEAKELMEGCYINYLPEWYEVFEQSQIKIIFFDELVAEPIKVMNDLCSFIDIPSDIFQEAEFTVENKSVGYNSSILHSLAIKVFALIEPVVRKSYWLKKVLRSSYYLLNGKVQDKTIDDATFQKISGLYVDSNQRLNEFLRDKYQKDVPDWLKAGLSE